MCRIQTAEPRLVSLWQPLCVCVLHDDLSDTTHTQVFAKHHIKYLNKNLASLLFDFDNSENNCRFKQFTVLVALYLFHLFGIFYTSLRMMEDVIVEWYITNDAHVGFT
jgi:hypothetical protein